MSILFGTAGIPNRSKKKGVIGGLEDISLMGLSGMELEFVRGMRLSDETLLNIRQKAEELNLFITSHAPYYINFSSLEEEKIIASRNRLLKSAVACELAGGRDVVFHAGYYQKREAEFVYREIERELVATWKELSAKGSSIVFRPEITGKPSQFGSLKELLGLAKKYSFIKPCIDFSHLYTRSIGEINSKQAFLMCLSEMEETLGNSCLQELHCHVSGIEYGPKGEKKHLPLQESEFDYKGLLEALYEKNASGTIICESPLMEEDALILQKYYKGLANEQSKKTDRFSLE